MAGSLAYLPHLHTYPCILRELIQTTCRQKRFLARLETRCSAHPSAMKTGSLARQAEINRGNFLGCLVRESVGKGYAAETGRPGCEALALAWRDAGWLPGTRRVSNG